MRTDLTSEASSAHLKADRAVIAARRLRKAMTPAEQRLWFELRRLPLERTHFRRQSPSVRTSSISSATLGRGS